MAEFNCPNEAGGGVHVWSSDTWGIYCEVCGEMRIIKKDQEEGEFITPDTPPFFEPKH